MAVLASLPRVALEDAVDAEVAAAKAVCELVGDGSEKNSTSAWLSLFTLCFRNGVEACISVFTSDAIPAAIHESVIRLGDGRLDGLDGVLLMGAAVAMGDSFIGLEMGPRCTGAERATMERRSMAYLKH
eukprot:COSAG01_NODE_3985_length_5465_cov_3.480432_7_plen_128_part_01